MAPPRAAPSDAAASDPPRRPWPLRAIGHLDGFLVAIVVTVGLASLLPVRAAAARSATDLAQIGVGLLFFLHGAKLSTRAALDGLRNWRLHLTVFAATFALF